MSDDTRKNARALILARRAKFMAATLASLAATSGVAGGLEACGGESNDPVDDGGARGDAKPQPCLDVAADASPQPCLDVVPSDAGADADAGDADANPQPCLSMPAPDSGM